MRMNISCCWLYAITKYGYPPSLPDTFKVLGEMRALGFDAVELEGVRRENLLEVYAQRSELKKFCDGEGLRVINFCPVMPGTVSLERKERAESWGLFKYAIEIANYFEAETIQGDSFTPPLKFRGDAPYQQSITYGKSFKVEIDPTFEWQSQWEAMVESFSFMAREAKQAGLRF